MLLYIRPFAYTCAWLPACSVCTYSLSVYLFFSAWWYDDDKDDGDDNDDVRSEEEEVGQLTFDEQQQGDLVLAQLWRGEGKILYSSFWWQSCVCLHVCFQSILSFHFSLLFFSATGSHLLRCSPVVVSVLVRVQLWMHWIALISIAFSLLWLSMSTANDKWDYLPLPSFFISLSPQSSLTHLLLLLTY